MAGISSKVIRMTESVQRTGVAAAGRRLYWASQNQSREPGLRNDALKGPLDAMGNVVSSANIAAAVGIDSYVSELTDVQYERSLGGARLMKTIKCRHREGALVVKIFVKPSAGLPLGRYIEELRRERRALESVPNVLFHQRIIETERAAYSVRQYVFSSLYDRLSTRPFLCPIEKKWIAFQLLKGLSDIHARQVQHGDIKTENIMVTSWTWAFYVDFANYKPVYLPEDNPADFFFFFDTSARRTCYLAPERFHSPKEKVAAGGLSPAMDVFSLGCVLAELFLEKPLFDLSQLLRYRNGDYDPLGDLGHIEDTALRDMIAAMIRVNPAQRGTAEDHLRRSFGTVFPPLFRDFLHDYLGSLTQPPKDLLAPYQWQSPHSKKLLVSEADYRIEKLHREMSTVLDITSGQRNGVARAARSASDRFAAWTTITNLGDVGIPQCTLKMMAELPATNIDILSVILTTMVCANSHACVFVSAKLCAMDLLLALSINAEDEHKLDRVVPFLVVYLQDDVPVVRATAVRVLTQLLLSVESLTPGDIQVFPEYILPNLRRFAVDTELNVRVAYASCLSSLAECAMRFLQMAQLLRKNLPSSNAETDYGDTPHGTYDSSLRDIQDLVQEDVAALLVDPNPAVKRTLLADVAKLCSFLGPTRSNDVVLSHLITYLNDRDWLLRSAFFDSIVGVGLSVGGKSLEDYVLPLMIQALSDEEEFVVAKALSALTDLSNAGFIGKTRLIEAVETAVPLLCHPNIWVRYGAVSLTVAAAKSLAPVEVRVFVYPLVKPFLRRELSEVTELDLLDKLKPPLPRILYDQTMTFASQSPAALADLRDISLPLNDPLIDGKPVIKRLKELGLTEAERAKILSLYAFIARASRSRDMRSSASISDSDRGDSSQSAFMPLKMLGVTPHTVFLTPPTDEKQKLHPEGLKDAAQGSMVIVSGGRLSVDLDPSGRSSPAGSRLRNDQRGRTTRPLTPRGSGHVTSASPSRTNSFPAAGDRGLGRRETALGVGAEFSSSTFVIGTEGRPQNVIPLLEKKAAHFFPPEMDLGKVVGDAGTSPVGAPLDGVLSSLKNWKPEGTLVGSFHEHSAAINQVRISPDFMFFATCSNDGTVKIWDCARLEQNVTNRARLSLVQGGKVTSVAFCEQSHSVASASTTGSVHVSRVECSYTGATPKYSGLDGVRRFDLPDGEHATLLHHYSEELSSVLMYSTNRGRICGLDLRTMKDAWTFPVPAEYGTTTAFVVDRNHNWFVSGSSMGTFVLWDIRFGLPLKSWGHPSRSRINFLSLDSGASGPGRHMGAPKLTASVEGPTEEVSVWDIETAACEQVFCVIDADNDRAEDEMNALYGRGVKASSPAGANDLLGGARYGASKFSRVGGVSGVVYTPDGKGMISAGADRKIRFWDLQSVEKSYLVSNPDVDSPAPKYRYVRDSPTPERMADGIRSFQRHENTSFYLEYSPVLQYPANTGPLRSGTSSAVSSRKSSTSSSGRSRLLGDASLASSSQQPQTSSSSSSLSAPTQSYHLDTITDIQITPFPYPMLITTSYDGVIKVLK
ncbi:hypothetical protein DFJ74DRAFT_403557 [Hyaloraphidium curvatum]|nr:hypothetical protein DFJ74DRAFT_403557 [Hyaloraphidium curvatum]